MTKRTEWTIVATAASEYDLTVERDVFADASVSIDLRSVDVDREADLIDAGCEADAIIDRLFAVPYSERVIDGFDRCRAIARCGIGVDGIAHEYAAERGIAVVNTPEYCLDEVADHTLSLVLALERDLRAYDRAMHDGRWDRRSDAEVHRLSERTLGLVGFGAIARRVAQRVRVFGMDVLATDPYVDDDAIREADATPLAFDALLERADVLSLHAPLTDATEGMIGADALARLSSSAHLVNVSRGGLVVEDALVDALESDSIAGAALDVFADEPPDQGSGASFDHPLRGRENVILTPHVGWFSREANEERRRTAAEDVRRVLEDERPENAVNEPVGANWR